MPYHHSSTVLHFQSDCVKTTSYNKTCVNSISCHVVLTWPVLSVVLACGDDTAYSKLPGPPQTHAGSAGGSPEDKQDHCHFAVVKEVLRSLI